MMNHINFIREATEANFARLSTASTISLEMNGMVKHELVNSLDNNQGKMMVHTDNLTV